MSAISDIEMMTTHQHCISVHLSLTSIRDLLPFLPLFELSVKSERLIQQNLSSFLSGHSTQWHSALHVQL